MLTPWTTQADRAAATPPKPEKKKTTGSELNETELTPNVCKSCIHPLPHWLTDQSIAIL